MSERVLVINETSRADFEEMVEASLERGYMFLRESFKVYVDEGNTHYVILMAKFLTPIARLENA